MSNLQKYKIINQCKYNNVKINIKLLTLTIIIISSFLPLKVSAIELTSAENKLLEKLAKSLNSVSTMEASFSQSTDEGDFSRGTMYIKRPDKFRIEYSNGSLLIGNDNILKFIDKELREVQQIFISGTPAEFLVRPSLNFFKDVSVLDIISTNSKVEVRIKQTDSGNSGEATLFFNAKTFILEGWKIKDALDKTIEFNLFDHEFGKETSNKLFVFYPPPSWSR